MPPVQPYHYGSHYSNSGTVLHFLVRLPPFTKMFLAYQGRIAFNFHLAFMSRFCPNSPGKLHVTLFSTVYQFQIPEFGKIKSVVLTQ